MLTPQTDLLTNGNFTSDEWNHLRRLFNIMNFSMFSCSHLSNFLSDPIRKQSAMSKRGQEGTSSEGFRWQNQSQWIQRWRCRDPWIWCCTTRWVRGRALRKSWAIPSIHGMPKKNKAVFQLVSGNWCGTQAEIQSSFLKWGDRSTLKKQTPGNRKTGMTLRAQSVPGNWCGRWNTKEEFS